MNNADEKKNKNKRKTQLRGRVWKCGPNDNTIISWVERVATTSKERRPSAWPGLAWTRAKKKRRGPQVTMKCIDQLRACC